MSKAEERAKEYVSDLFRRRGQIFQFPKAGDAFLDGYHQAEKDLELSWKDVSELNCLLNEVEQEFKKGLHEDKTYIGYCQEVLKRFKEEKGNKV